MKYWTNDYGQTIAEFSLAEALDLLCKAVDFDPKCTSLSPIHDIDDPFGIDLHSVRLIQGPQI